MFAMTFLTQQHPISRVIPKQWGCNPREDMMHFQRSCRFVTPAFLTFTAFPCPYLPQKFLVPGSFPIAGTCPTTPIRVHFPKKFPSSCGTQLLLRSFRHGVACVRRGPSFQCLTNFTSRFWRRNPSGRRGFPLTRGTEFGAGFWRLCRIVYCIFMTRSTRPGTIHLPLSLALSFGSVAFIRLLTPQTYPLHTILVLSIEDKL
jgi:hypothetical protein